MCPIDRIIAAALDYIRDHPEEYAKKSYLDGILAAWDLFSEAGCYDYNDVAEWSEEELIEEAKCWF